MKKKKTVEKGRESYHRLMIQDLQSQNIKLSSLLNVSREIMREVNLERLMRLIMKKVTSVMDAERSTLYLLDAKTDELYALVAQQAKGNILRFPNGTGLAGSAAKTGDTINLKDAYQDPRFNKDFDRRTGFRTRSMLCMPIRNTKGQILGVIQVLNKKGNRVYFTEEDENLLAAFSSIAAISLENSFSYETINRTMAVFEKFVPRRYIASIARNGLDSIVVGNAEVVNVSILFSDIRDFTTISEKMDPDETLQFINKYLERMSDVIAKNNGFVDKFIGDAIMAVFDSSHTGDAVKAGVDMLHALHRFNRERARAGKDEIRIGVGLHFGNAVLGTVGSKDRMDSTIIGDSVNIGSRIEGLTKIYACPLLVTESVVDALPDRDLHWIREVDMVRVKGKDRPLRIFEVYDADPAGIRNRKKETADLLTEGLSLYRERDFQGALQRFEKGGKRLRADRVFKIHLERCRSYLDNSEELPDDWDGAFRLLEK